MQWLFACLQLTPYKTLFPIFLEKRINDCASAALNESGRAAHTRWCDQWAGVNLIPMTGSTFEAMPFFGAAAGVLHPPCNNTALWRNAFKKRKRKKYKENRNVEREMTLRLRSKTTASLYAAVVLIARMISSPLDYGSEIMLRDAVRCDSGSIFTGFWNIWEIIELSVGILIFRFAVTFDLIEIET